MDKIVRETIRRIRKNRKISQMELSKLMGISQAFYSQVESGKKEMSLPTFFDLLHQLDCKFMIIDEKTNPKYAGLLKEIIALNIELK